jgi:thioredoxin 1
VVHALTQETFETEVRNSGVPTVVDFYADWCEPCRQLAPIVEEMSR